MKPVAAKKRQAPKEHVVAAPVEKQNGDHHPVAKKHEEPAKPVAHIHVQPEAVHHEHEANHPEKEEVHHHVEVPEEDVEEVEEENEDNDDNEEEEEEVGGDDGQSSAENQWFNQSI